MPDEEIIRIMVEHDLEKDDAERVQEIMEEYDLDEYEAVELMDDL